MMDIHNKALDAQNNIALAAIREIEAISLVEKEIESWNS